MENPKLMKFAIFHRDCYCSKMTEKFPSVRMKQGSTVRVLENKNGLVTYQCLFELFSDSRKELEGALDFLANFKGVKVTVLKDSGLRILTIIKAKAPESMQDEVMKGGGDVLDLVPVKDGFEIHTVLTHKPRELKKRLEELDDVAELKILKIGEVETQKPDDLTEKQIEAFRHAYAMGYYSWPRGITLEELAEKDGISRRAFQERLRKAESKLIAGIAGELAAGKQWKKKEE